MIAILGEKRRAELFRAAMLLAWITIGYNTVEGLVSVYFGLEDETIALLGFGLDSFVEVISGVGIAHMLIRSRMGGSTDLPDHFEALALRITGSAFYLLFAGLVATSALRLYSGEAPETTMWGVGVSLVSIFSMWALIHYKLKVGRALGSDALVADAHCTRACMYLSIALLISSAGYELLGLGWLDALGAVVIAVLSLKEGREAFEKARGKACSCGGACSTE